MTCTHYKPANWVWQDVDNGWETESQLVNIGGQSACEDIDIGRFHCTLCGKVMYYTGLWKDFYETGKPRPGSERIRKK